MAGLQGRTLLITGASRGIGLAIALRAARDGANVVIAAKTTRAHPKLPGTIQEAAAAVEAAGGRAAAVAVDVREGAQIEAAVARAVELFGGLDILVNNAGAIGLTGTRETTLKRFDLMFGVNARGAFACARACLPELERSAAVGRNPHILNISPPLSLDPRWLRAHAAYTVSKYAMSFWVLGMAAELRPAGVAVNALWPRTTIATAAVRNLLGGEPMVRRSRTPEIMADAAHAVLCRDARACTGRLLLDEEVLREEGVTDLESYAVAPGMPLQLDLFVAE